MDDVSLLAAEGVAYAYPGGVQAVCGVDLTLRPGELLVVAGPNGSGKSTLLRLLAGLLEPAAGSVTSSGDPVGALEPRERARRLAWVPQALDHWPAVTVERFVQGGRYAHTPWSGTGSGDRAAVHAALMACDVGELGGRLFGELSGGQRQRVLLARSLAQEAPVLLVDEPTASLDPGHQLDVFALLARLVAERENGGAIVITHDLNLASQFATRIVLLDEGRVVAAGTAAEVLVPDVLAPVYGAELHFGKRDGRPYVLPWRTEQRR